MKHCPFQNTVLSFRKTVTLKQTVVGLKNTVTLKQLIFYINFSFWMSNKTTNHAIAGERKQILTFILNLYGRL